MVFWALCLRETRMMLGESQLQFADRLGIGQPMLSKWEGGQIPNIRTRMVIQDMLDEIWREARPELKTRSWSRIRAACNQIRRDSKRS